LPGFFIIDKKTNKSRWLAYIKDELLGLMLSTYYPHDGDDNRIMFIIKPDEWLNNANTDNLPSHMQEIIKASTISADSNPILVFYKEIQ
jgi:hypothetical protein